MPDVIVIGLGLCAEDLTAAHRADIEAADILMGGRRHLDQVPWARAERVPITGDMDRAVAYIRDRMDRRRIVVLASGDPLFFGIGALLVKRLGNDRVCIRPNVSSMAAAFARLGLPWSRAVWVSLHGRDDTGDLVAGLRAGRPVAVLTDDRHHPGWLADYLVTTGFDTVRMAVFERLGLPDECWGWYPLDRADKQKFTQPNLVILQPESDHPVRPLTLGMPDSAFDHENGLITKAEIRAVALSRLRLAPGMTFWDLGAGSGAVAIEASLLAAGGHIVAVEQHAGRADQIRANARRFGVPLTVVTARLPAGLEDLPAPDRIFIGGGGKDLAAIITAAANQLKPGGIMAVNTVLLDTLAAARGAFATCGMTAETVQVQIGRSRTMPYSQRLEPLTPVWIVTGGKEHAS